MRGQCCPAHRRQLDTTSRRGVVAGDRHAGGPPEGTQAHEAHDHGRRNRDAAWRAGRGCRESPPHARRALGRAQRLGRAAGLRDRHGGATGPAGRQRRARAAAVPRGGRAADRRLDPPGCRRVAAGPRGVPSRCPARCGRDDLPRPYRAAADLATLDRPARRAGAARHRAGAGAHPRADRRSNRRLAARYRQSAGRLAVGGGAGGLAAHLRGRARGVRRRAAARPAG